MSQTTKIIFVAAIISVVCVLPGARAAVLPRTAKLVPAETVFLMDVDNFGQLRQQFEKTNLYKLYKDPAMDAFIKDARAKWREKIQGLDSNNIFDTFFNTDILPQGRVAAALVFSKQGTDAAEMVALFITQWGEKIDKIKEAVGKKVEKAIEDGAHKKVEDYRGVSITTIIDGTGPKFSYVVFDDCFISSDDIELLKFTIAHIKGATSATLADDTDYTATMAAIGPYHDVDFYANIKQIIKAMLVKDATGTVRSIITNLGFDNIKSAGISLGLARRAGSNCRGKIFLKIDGAKKGICRMFELESDVLRAPRFIPASVYSVSFLNLNFKKAYDELYSILYNLSPMTATSMHAPVLPPSPSGEPGVQLKRDIIDHLGLQTVITQSINKSLSDSPVPTEILIALGVVNRSALEKSLSLVHSKMLAPNDPDARRELLGHTIYLVGLSALPFLPGGITPMQIPADTGTLQMPKLAFTITDTHLIFGVESAVERAIRALSSGGVVSLNSAKWFTSAKLSIPSVVGLARLEDTAASSEFFWRMMKESGKVNTLSSFSFGPQKAEELVNLSLLPEFDAVRKYFGSSTFYGISRQDGFFFEFN
jgi:hypothetical protein